MRTGASGGIRALVSMMVLLTGCRRDTCLTSVVASYPSPGNELTAVVFTRQCSDDTTTNISLLNPGVAPRGEGNVFVSEGRRGPELQWFTRNRLEIRFDSLTHVSRKEPERAAVRIRYIPQ